VFWLAACGANGAGDMGDSDFEENSEAVSTGDWPEPVEPPADLTGFPGSLDEAGAIDQGWERIVPAEPRALDEAQTAALLARLEPLPERRDDREDFALRPGSQPPPRTGEVERAEFPPLEERQPPVVEPADGPLRLLRYSPEGAVDVAGQISLTFDRPMVAVSSHDALAGAPEGIAIEPGIDGRWRWVGTRTLLFEPQAARLPMATEFRVDLGSELRAADGAALETPVSFSFSTPPLEWTRLYPQGEQVGLDPMLVMTFNQRIEPEALLEHIAIKDEQDRELAFVLADDADLAADEQARSMVENVPASHWLALKLSQSLPSDQRIELRLGAGAPSAEGDAVTDQAQVRSFRTYPPFVVQEINCGWNRTCAPEDPVRLRFSSPIAPDQKLADLVSIEPELLGFDVQAWGNNLVINGLKRGRTDHRITLSASLIDTFGQNLGGDRDFTVEVGSARAMLSLGVEQLTTLDPLSPPILSFFSINYRSLKVRIHWVQPSDWPAYRSLSVNAWQRAEDEAVELPGEPVFMDSVDIDAEPDQPVRTSIDLSPWLDGDGRGHLVALFESGDSVEGAELPYYSPRELTWIQSTDIGIDASVDARNLLVWATDLGTGQPLEGARVTVEPSGGQGASDASGLVDIALEDSADPAPGAKWIQVERDGDVALLPESGGWSGRTDWVRRETNDRVLWQVFDDRGIYRPGETVHLKAWLRLAEQRPDGGLALLPDDRAIVYAVFDSRNNRLHQGRAKVGALGGFELSFELPDTPNLGRARIDLTLETQTRLDNASFGHSFSIEEFRTPEFEVSTRVSAGPHVGAEPVSVEVEAAYYAGGALPAAPVRWTLTARPGHYAPPGHDGWHFGFISLGWFPFGGMDGGSASREYQGETDGGGRHGLELAMDFEPQPRPLRVDASASVTDVNRQTWIASSEFLVHPGEAYVGLKTETFFVERGEPLTLELIATDIDGETLADHPIVVEAARIRSIWRGRQVEQERDDVQRCRVRTDSDGLAGCTFDTETGGQYELTATIQDGSGRRNASRLIRWVGGGRMPGADSVEIEQVLLIPDKDSHRPGEVAKLLVQAPFEDAEGLLTLRRHGFAEKRRFRIEGGSTTLEIPLRRDWLPNIEAHVMLVGQADRAGLGELGDSAVDVPKRPAIAIGQHKFSLSTADRVLDIELSPARSALAPGESTEVELLVTDADGAPVAGAELALVAVDEAILALSGHTIADPLSVFYVERRAEVRDHHLRPGIRLLSLDQFAVSDGFGDGSAVPPSPMAMESADYAQSVRRSAVGAAAPPASEPIAIRSDFNPLAAFVPRLVTDEQGRVRTRIDLPDNLTRYRVIAVAVDGATRFGKAETNLTARLPLMVRPSPPRFLNFGDRFEFPVVVQNQTDAPLEVRLAMAAANLELSGPAGLVFDVPARDRREVRLPAAALEAGTARYQIATATSDFADAARGEMPVWTPATTEAFATYGVIDDGALVQPVITPDNIWPQFGQLDVTTSSTAVQTLTDAFLYLNDYPFQCSEQVASRMLAVAALRDVLEAFEVADLPAPEQIERSMAADLDRLAGLQNGDGGFGLWRRGQESWPYATLHVAHALVRATNSGYAVDEQLLERSLQYLRDIDRRIPSDHPDRVRRHVVAYALYVRGLTGDYDRQRARSLIAEVDDLDELSFESLGWLLGVLSGDSDSTAELERLRRFLANRVTETAAGAQFVSVFQDGDHLIMHSDRRADGIILEAMMRDQPESDLIPKLVQGLQAHRTRGRWSNTQDNAFVLLALNRYFRQFEGTEPDFIARTWLGEDFAGEQAFRGRSVDSHRIEIPMAWLARDDGQHDLILDKDGAGRLYYRIGLSYAPSDLELEAASHGFEVTRRYSGVDDPDDVRQREDGVWEIRSGARVEVELELVAPARRYHVALVDPLPAGLESINPALAVSDRPDSGETPSNPFARGRFWWWGPWYEHQNLRSERTEAFASLLPGGVYRYSYFARATTPGEFVVPPAKAEEMYQPETFGRSASVRVIVREFEL